MGIYKSLYQLQSSRNLAIIKFIYSRVQQPQANRTEAEAPQGVRKQDKHNIEKHAVRGLQSYELTNFHVQYFFSRDNQHERKGRYLANAYQV